MAEQPEKTMFGHGMLKRSFLAIVGIALLFCTVATVCILRVQTASAVDIPGSYSVTVSMPSELNDVPGASADVVYDVYKVADAKKISGVDAYEFEPAAVLNGSSINWNDVGSVAFYNSLSQIACTYTPLNPAITADTPQDQKLQRVAANLSGGEVVNTFNTGEAYTFEAGLYLIIAHQRGLDPQQYTRIADGVYSTIAVSDYYEFSFSPRLLAIPYKEDKTTGVISTAGPGDWVNPIEVTLKSAQTQRYGSLQIEKTLLSYENSSAADFVFQVDAYNNEEPARIVYSNVVRIHFDQAGQKAVLLEGVIPAGSNVTVTEVYSGASYRIVGDASVQVGPIAADPIEGETTEAFKIATVSFTNEYDERTNQGGSIVNNFTYATPEEKSRQGVTDLQWLWSKE